MSVAVAYSEWTALLERRRRFNTSGQDGSDFAQWMQSRVIEPGTQLDLFP